ncbi:hypothetical protein ACEPAG_2251 [Sanghuangporus baumii]
MEAFEGRLRSFDKPKTKASNKSPRGTWPHPGSFVATPTTLAEAGFFFKPSKDDPDNVQCFICKKELAGWDEDDNPFEIHYKKCPKCPWAIARCSLEFDVDADGKFSITDSSRLPTNKVLEKARADTFGGKKWWPHDGVKNHGATSKKMAKAGFVYTPQSQGDDTATCFYCNLSLSGWDAEDDPTDEHVKRVERSGKPCPFFQTTEKAKSQASTRPTKSASRKSRAPSHVDTPTDEDEDESPTVKAPVRRGKQKENESGMLYDLFRLHYTSRLKVSTGIYSAFVEKVIKPPPKLSDADDTEDLEEDEDPSLKAQPVQMLRKSSRKPPSKVKPSSNATGRSKQKSKPPSEEPDEIESGRELDPKRARSRTKSGKPSSKEQNDTTAESEREIDKPPSNVDGKVAKAYTDFTVDINVIEEARSKDKDKDRGRSNGRRGRSTSSRGRSRSKSKPRSMSASTLIDPHERPLLRASSRSRTSGLTEVEEMETEKMLAETPSETDMEPEPEVELQKEPTRATKPKSRAKKMTTDSDLQGVEQKLDRPSSRPVSVISEKSTSSKASKRGKAAGKKVAAKTKGKHLDVASSNQRSQLNSGAEEELQAITEVHSMEVDDDHGQEVDEATPKVASAAPKHPLFPASASPSDLSSRTALPKPTKQLKPTSKTKSDRNDFSGLPDTGETPVENGAARQTSVKAKKPISGKSVPASKQLEKQSSRMDVDDDRGGHARSQEKSREQPVISDPVRKPPADTRVASPPRTPGPPADAPLHPTTPVNQIIRDGHLPKPTAETTPADFRNSLQIPPSPADLFLPPLANAPIPVITALTEEERSMTVEQWIRHEMAVQYQRLKEDGERRIRAFLEKAEETRRQIEAL